MTEDDFFKQLKEERELLEKVRDDNKKLVEDLRNLKAQEILSGKADTPKQEIKQEVTPQEYAKLALEGKV